jgi:hypothetical protein
MQRLLIVALAIAGCSRSSTERAPTSPETICSDDQIGHTYGGGAAGCREYLDACLADLTLAERDEWRRAVTSCLRDESSLFTCYSEIPRC